MLKIKTMDEIKLTREAAELLKIETILNYMGKNDTALCNLTETEITVINIAAKSVVDIIKSVARNI